MVSVLGAIVIAVSWTDVVDFLAGLIPRRAKLYIGAVFAVLVLFVPAARAVVVVIGMAFIHDVSTSLTRELTPALTVLETPPSGRG